jgi:tRNA U34 5-methylaminomethyl-2-thiouridine-forming methyltransferase MnmC
VTRDGAFELVTLRNGHRAVRHLGHGEVMHPSVGPWAEANRLYVEQTRLFERLHKKGAGKLTILDVGLGAAANAVAALSCAAAIPGSERRELEVVSLEVDLAPLRLALADPEGFPFLVPFAEAGRALSSSGRWEQGGLTWKLVEGDASEQLAALDVKAELVFFDPFSPEHNPSLWTPETLARVRERCSDDALLATYSAATPTRVSLLLAGFFVGAGWSIGTKAETTVASTSGASLEKPLDATWLGRWTRSTARAPHGHELTEALEAAVRAHPQLSAPNTR